MTIKRTMAAAVDSATSSADEDATTRARKTRRRPADEKRNSWKKTNEQPVDGCSDSSHCHKTSPTIRVCPLRRTKPSDQRGEGETDQPAARDEQSENVGAAGQRRRARNSSNCSANQSRDQTNQSCRLSPGEDAHQDETKGQSGCASWSQGRYLATPTRRKNVISNSNREHAHWGAATGGSGRKCCRQVVAGPPRSPKSAHHQNNKCHLLFTPRAASSYNYFHSPITVYTILLSSIIIFATSNLFADWRPATTAAVEGYQLTNNLIANNLPPKFITTTTTTASGSSSSSNPNQNGQQQQSNSEIVVRVKEGPQSIGKLICTLKGEDPDDDPLTFGVLGSMASDLLRIDNVPGNQANVYLKKELDRETTESHQVVITLTDGKLGRGNWITKSMLIIVEDVNDNYPVFGPHRTAISIREDSKAPLVIETIEATDADEGRFGQVIYKLDELHDETSSVASSSLSASNGKLPIPIGQIFSIDTVDGKGVVSLIGQLDYEQRPLYQLRIIAIDRAAEHERLMATTSILISVEDCEDQPPMFTFAPSITRIPEDLAIGSPILRVTAIDGDRGVNNPIKYNILSVNNQDSGPERNLFSIGTDSGQISVAHELDRESLESGASQQANPSWLSSLTGGNSKSLSNQPGAYVLQVQALEVSSADDQGDSAATAPDNSVTTELTVILTDVNDEAPTFNQPNYYGELLENSPAESLVAFVSSPPAPTTNQDQPQQQQQQSNMLTSLARVFDRDQGRNGTFTLHLEGEHAHLFDIWPREATNEANLMVKVSQTAFTGNNPKYFDFERTKELHFYLVAREKFPSISSSSGPSGNRYHASSQAKMTVYLKDANDNYPQFDSELYRVEIPENAIRGMHICAVKATDLDSNAYGNSGIRYTEIRGENANKFKLDPLTGIITLKTNEHGFDRETIPQHHLIVEARDSNGLGNRNTTQLLIVLTDINDQRPKFLLDQYEAFIYENELDFQNPLQVQAVDNDAASSLNSRIVYSIAAGDPQQNFTIDPQTGRIRVRTTLMAPPPQPTPGQLAAYNSSRSHVSLENPGGESDIIIEQGNGAGSRNSQLQPLQATGLDFERIAQKRDDTRQFNLTIRATDSGQPEALWGTTNVIISVYDKNDHAPVFTRSIYSKTIREDAKEASQVVQVLAQDGDHSPINSKITYRISSGSSDKFAIDSETGLISVAHGANLDIDQTTNGQKRTNYLLNVVAFDGSFGPNQKSSSCLVNITILDVNNKAPEFVSLGGVIAGQQQTLIGSGGTNNKQQPATTFAPQQHQQNHHLAGASVFVNEDAPYGLIVTRVVAIDLDSNADLRYSINWARSEARNEEMALVEPALFRDCFSIDATDGTIKVAKPLDRELFDQIKLRLQVEDVAAQTSDQLAQTYLLVKITDINDNRPTFKKPLYKAVVNENSISGTSVLTLSADDRDLNKTIRYSLETSSAEAMRLVRINPKSGEITVNDKIDRELFPVINVTVKAEDQGYPHSLVGSTQLLITVRDENDNNPIFLNSTHLRPLAARDNNSGNDDQPRNHNMATGSGGHSTYRSRSLGPPAAGGRSYLPPASGEHAILGDDSLDVVGSPFAQQPFNLPLLSPGSTAKVSEDSPVGHQVAFVRAEDADLGNNGRVTYLLDASSSGGKFRIDRDSGIISVAQPLDREQNKQFTLIIEACDNYDLGYSTGESRRAFTQVYIQITDVNDNIPIVKTNLQVHQNNLQFVSPVEHQIDAGHSDPLAHHHPTYDEAMQSPGPYELPMTECLFINEFQPTNEPILTIFATDADDPETPNGQVNLAIINNLPQNELFGLVPVNEKAASQQKRSTLSPSATTTIADGSSSASSGADLTGFGDLLVGGESVLSSRRQKRSAVGESQLEPGNFYSPATTATHHVRLGGTGASLAANGQRQQSPASIGRSISAPSSATYDLDQPNLATTTTTVLPTTTTNADAPATTTTATSSTGNQQAHLVVLQSLKERVGNYTILVRATDLGQPALASIRSINVCVQDVNNHAPVFVRPPALNNNHTIRIMENSTIGSFVTQVEATDLDYGLNGRLQYSLKPTNFIQNGNQQRENDWQSFKIDRFSGVITTAKQFNRQLKKYYTLRVQAQDFGRPTSLSSDIDLNIMIANSGKYQPEFETQVQSLQFSENIAPGVEWFTLMQTNNLDDDPALINANNIDNKPTSQGSGDTSGHSNLNWLASPCYYIIDGDDHEQVFQLDRYTHRLTNQKVIDREKKANYTLLVQASNNCNKPPRVAAPSEAAAVASGARVRRSPAHESGASVDKSSEPATGKLLPSRSPTKQKEQQSTGDNDQAVQAVSSTLASIDSWLASDKSLLKVVIKIKDLNDNPPKFTQRIYTGGITTEADFGTVFMIAQAIDIDADANGQVTYSIVKPIKRHLAISSPLSAGQSARRSGQLIQTTTTTATPPTSPPPATQPKRLKRNDNEQQLQPTTTTQPTGSSTTSLQIQFPYSSNSNSENVYSENDFNPMSPNSLSDELPLANDGDDLFVINSQTGEISLNFDPQKHMKGYFEFEILAKDIENLTDTARVFIYLLRQDQRVKFVLRLTPQELRQRLNKFRSVFGNITGAIVNIDSYKYYENHDGTVDKKKTSLFLHFVNPEDNTIIDVHKVLALIDNNIEYLDELYKEFHVLSSEAAQLPLSSNGALVDPIDQVRTGLMGISSFLALILILVIALYLNQRTRYERQLKAATVTAFGSSPLHIDPDFHSQTNLPNTNLHSQDPNPIWMNGGYNSDQVDWLAPGGGGVGNIGGNNMHNISSSKQQRQAAGQARQQSLHHQQQQQLASNSSTGVSGKLIHSGSSGVGGMTLDDDDIDELSSTTSGGQSVDLASIGGVKRGGSQHLHNYNGTTTATPRDSLNSSNGQISSAGSGSGSASTTNERQVLCGRDNIGSQKGSSQSAKQPVGGRQTPINHLQQQQQHNHVHQLKKATRSHHLDTNHLDRLSIGGNTNVVNTGGSSTFGAMKEVTIYTDHQHHQHHLQRQAQHPAYAQPVKSSNNQVRSSAQVDQNLARPVEPNQQQVGKTKQQPTIYVTNIKQTVAAINGQNQNQNRQRILVHSNKADVEQGIIKNLNSSIQQKTNNLNAKFVPANNNFSSTTTNQQQQQDASVQNFETSLSKLSILNLETTEL